MCDLENTVGEVVGSRTNTARLVTSAAKATMPALTAWKTAHVRWNTENTAIRFLKHHTQLEHAYRYNPQVMEGLLRCSCWRSTCSCCFFIGICTNGERCKGLSDSSTLIW